MVDASAWNVAQVKCRSRCGKEEKSLNRILERLNPPLSVLNGNDFFFSSFRSLPFVTNRPDNNQSVAQNLERGGELLCVGVRSSLITIRQRCFLPLCGFMGSGEASQSLIRLVWAPLTPSLWARTRWGVEQSAKFINLSNLLCCTFSTNGEPHGPFDYLGLICHPAATVCPLWASRDRWSRVGTMHSAPPISHSSLNTKYHELCYREVCKT